MSDDRLRVRCQGHLCRKLLGIVDERGRLVTESNRQGKYVKTIMEKGIVICKFCGTELAWNAFTIPRAEPVFDGTLEEVSHG